MKTITNITTVLLLIMFSMGSATAQMSDHKFQQLFTNAFAQLVEGEHERALPTLRTLADQRPQHAQVGYLAAMTILHTGGDATEAYGLLKAASKKFDPMHRYGDVNDRSAPAKVWFHLGNACMQRARYREAVNAYSTYMTCVPLSSIEHKKMVLKRIKEARDAQQQMARSSAQNNEPVNILQP